MKKYIKSWKRIILAILIVMAIEVFICNYTAFRTSLNEDKNINKEFIIDNNTIVISNINTRVTSININYKDKLNDKITYNVKYVAEDTSDLISLNPKVILENQSQYINLDTHSKCQTIQIDLQTENEIEIESIILNKVNFKINFYRMFILFVIAIFAVKVKDKSIYELNYDETSKVHNYRFILNLIVFCSFVAIYVIYQFDFDSLLIKPEDINKEDSILMQTEAFVNGSIPLQEEASEALKNMENPYDHVKRNNEGIDYLYDVAYYNGKYYNYFGIAPIITLILPFRLLTGMYTHTYIFNMVYVFGSIIALYFLYKKLVDKFIKKVSLCNFYLGFFAIVFGANILTLLRGAKYDIVVSSGIMFLLISLNLAISIYENEKWKYVKLILLGITTALIVLSKPNLIIYYPIILFFILISMKDKTIKQKIIDGMFIAVPLGIFAIFQMIFNYLRFDNILEFGAKYQLTSFNMISCMSFTFGKMITGIMEYVFRTPIINPMRFPFVFINTDTSLVASNEVCYENRLVGLIAIPILWIYLFKNDILKKGEKDYLYWFVNISITLSIIAIIITTCLGGICEAYSVDFKIMLCISAVLLLLRMIEKEEKTNKIFLILCLATIFFMMPISFTTEENFLINLRSSITVFWKNIFEFWS